MTVVAVCCRWQRGRITEIAMLPTLMGLAALAGYIAQSWQVGVAVLLGLPAGFWLLGRAWEAWDRASLLRRAKAGLANADTRLEAVRLLESEGFELRDHPRAAEEAKAMLLPLLEDADVGVRVAAARTFCRMGVALPGLPAVFIAALDDAGTRTDALDGLRLLGQRAAPAVPGLIGLLADRRAPDWTRAIEVLAGIGPAAQEAVPALIDALQGASVDQVSESARALGAIGDPRALPALEHLAAHGKDERACDAGRHAADRLRAKLPVP